MNFLSTKRVEVVLLSSLAAQLGALWYFWSFTRNNGYLPSPFVYNKFDTFMDVYNPLWWNGADKYTAWGSVYPPLNFLILDAIHWLSFGAERFEDAADMRDFSLIPAFIVAGIGLLAPFVVVSTAYQSAFDGTQKTLVALVATISAPVLFTIERANLIFIALLFLPLAFNSQPAVRTIGIALLINLKPYFALFLLALAVAARWRELAATIALSGAIFVFTGLACDADFLHFLSNLINFSQSAEVIFSGRELLAFPSSISAFTHVINLIARTSSEPSLPLAQLQLVAATIEYFKIAAFSAFVASLIYARERLSIGEINAAMVVLIVNLGVWVGGYSQIFYIACIPSFMSMRFRPAYLAIVLAIFLPLDAWTLFEDPLGPLVSYTSGDVQNVVWQLGFGSFARPVLNILLLLLLTTEFLTSSLHDTYFATGTAK